MFKLTDKNLTQEHSKWIHLNDQDELAFLLQLMPKYGIYWKLVAVESTVLKTKNGDKEKLTVFFDKTTSYVSNKYTEYYNAHDSWRKITAELTKRRRELDPKVIERKARAAREQYKKLKAKMNALEKQFNIKDAG